MYVCQTFINKRHTLITLILTIGLGGWDSNKFS